MFLWILKWCILGLNSSVSKGRYCKWKMCLYYEITSITFERTWISNAVFSKLILPMYRFIASNIGNLSLFFFFLTFKNKSAFRCNPSPLWNKNYLYSIWAGSRIKPVISLCWLNIINLCFQIWSELSLFDQDFYGYELSYEERLMAPVTVSRDSKWFISSSVWEFDFLVL